MIMKITSGGTSVDKSRDEKIWNPDKLHFNDAAFVCHKRTKRGLFNGTSDPNW